MYSQNCPRSETQFTLEYFVTSITRVMDTLVASEIKTKYSAGQPTGK